MGEIEAIGMQLDGWKGREKVYVGEWIDVLHNILRVMREHEGAQKMADQGIANLTTVRQTQAALFDERLNELRQVISKMQAQIDELDETLAKHHVDYVSNNMREGA